MNESFCIEVSHELFCVLYERTNIQGVTDGALLDKLGNQLVIAEVVFFSLPTYFLTGQTCQTYYIVHYAFIKQRERTLSRQYSYLASYTSWKGSSYEPKQTLMDLAKKMLKTFRCNVVVSESAWILKN